MNLFVESLANYLTRQWDLALNGGGASKEARFILQSLGPQETLSLFRRLEEHAGAHPAAPRTRRYFRVAHGLWDAWHRQAGAAPGASPDLAPMEALDREGWVDREDRLTWYRNRLARDEGAEALVVVLVGLNHATDQGGLADFHVVDERRIQQEELGAGFGLWIDRIGERLGVEVNPTQRERFDVLLGELSRLRPLQLVKLADFLEPLAAGDPCYDFEDFRERVLGALPFWDIPPILAGTQAPLPVGSKAQQALKDAEAFISHAAYKTATTQNRALAKLNDAIDTADFVLPLDAAGNGVFTDKDDYKHCLEAFLRRADPAARRRLLKVDVMPIVTALRRPQPKGKSKDKPDRVTTFDDLSIQVFLQALWDALLAFESDGPDTALSERLGDIALHLSALEHDYRGADDDGEAVRGLLRGLLGGIERRFEDIGAELSRRWQREIRVTLEQDPGELRVLGLRGKKRPSLHFEISVSDRDGTLVVEDKPYRWYLDTTQPERVRHDCIVEAKKQWDAQGTAAETLLPAFRVRKESLTALFYASDEAEANRLVANAIEGMQLLDLCGDLAWNGLDAQLRPLLREFTKHYRAWLGTTLEFGYYRALDAHVANLINAYKGLAKALLDPRLRGAQDLLARVYKALLLVDEAVRPGDPYLSTAVAWGLSPAVLEQSLAQIRFLTDGFSEAVDLLSRKGPQAGKGAFARLSTLSRIQRPLTALITNRSGDLTTKVRELGLLHCLGEVDPDAKSLAVQTLLKEDESDDEDLDQVLRPCEEEAIVLRVLRLYSGLHDFAADGLRILAVNVTDLSLILRGVRTFLEERLAQDKGKFHYPPFECRLMVYSTSASLLAMESQLARWRDQVLAQRPENQRGLLLTVGHRFAPCDQVVARLKQERYQYDLAFLFHFLRADMRGAIEATRPFDAAGKGFDNFFPIAEYPRPIRTGGHDYREMLLSNRRLHLQTSHADLSARLRNRGELTRDHLILGQVDFTSWAEPVQFLHEHAQWVACIDSFVDKHLIGKRSAQRGAAQEDARRKIVGFESGLGDYGELNLTVSTEQDTLEYLGERVAGELRVLLPQQPGAASTAVAERVVQNAEEIVGLASLRAVLGKGEQIREVVGFAAINRMLEPPPGALLSQLLPIDALRDWFADADDGQRPDLLQLALETREQAPPLIHATVIECKLADRNSVYWSKAREQVQRGLFQLGRLLEPRLDQATGIAFDRRYWWAQLQRAIASRAEVNLSDEEWNRLNAALEQLAEGRYEICWRGVIFTFWRDVTDATPTVTRHPPADLIALEPGLIPPEFAIEQVELGNEGLVALFKHPHPPAALRFQPSGAAICVLAGEPERAWPEPPELPPEACEDAALGEEAEDTEWSDEPPPVPTPSGPSQPTASPEPPPATPPGPVQRTLPIPPPPDSPPANDAPPSAADVPDKEGTATEAPLAFALPERVLIGTRANGEPVYWHYGHEKLQNRHLLVFGTSGSGKTYGIQCLLAEIAVAGLRSLIVDYTDGFLPAQMAERFKAVARPESHFVVTDRLPLNPFRRQRQEIDPSLPLHEESDYQVASRIVSIFASVYDVGEQQLAALSRSLQAGLAVGTGFSLDELLPILREDGPQGLSLANKIEPFIQARPFKPGVESAWNHMLGTPEHGTHVLQLKGLSRENQRLVTEFVLWDLWDFAQSTGNEKRPIPIVLDEIQNLDHSADSPIDKMLREGRKFGLSLLLATQTTSNFNQEQRDRLFQAGHKLFFKPATTETDRFAQILAQATSGITKGEWAERLARLEKGQCWSLGPVPRPGGGFTESALLVSVTALEQRSFGA